MESTPSSSKRNRDDVFTSPEQDFDNKRHCFVSNDTSSDLNDTSDTMSDQDSADMSINTATNPASEGDQFLDKLMSTFENPKILAALCKTMTEVMRPIFRQELESLVQQNQALQQQVSDLTVRLDDKEQVIEALTDRLDRSEQYSRRNNLRIAGLTERDGEDTDKLVLKVAKRIGVDVKLKDIDISHRVPRYPPTPLDKTRPIIVRFVSNATKRIMLQSRKKLKSTGTPDEPRILINEDLTKTRDIIARKARQLVAEKKVESSWVAGGVILIKLKDGSVKKVATNSALDEVFEATSLKMVISMSQH